MSEKVVLLAGGGTGGHVFPMVAVAHALRRLCPEIRPIFVGTKKGMECKFVPEQGFELELLEVLPIRGRGLLGAFKGVTRAAALIPESRKLIRRFKPYGVFSAGGYAAGPVSLAARTLGVPVALMEPNSVVGLANWLIAPFVQRAYTAFQRAEASFSSSVVLASGVPLRVGFDPQPYELLDGPLRILVLGGSQGAKSVNETLPEALAGLKLPIIVTHQCGKAHLESVTARYQRLGAEFAQVVSFIDDMPAALAAADLVVGRSGAGAVSEITAIGRPSVLIPYPFASGDHQRLNALAIEKAGAALLIASEEASVSRIQAEISSLALDRPRLIRMAEAAAVLGRPRAAEQIARDFLQLSGIELAGGSRAPTGGEHSLHMPYGEVA